MEQQSDFYNDNNFNTNNLFQNEILTNPIISHPSTPTTNNSQNSTSPQSTTNHLIQQINNSSSHLSETGNINSTTPPITINSNINFSSQDVFDMSQNQLDPAMIASPFTDHEHHQLQQQIHVQSQLPSSDTHPIVPSQRSIDQQHLQRKLDEEHERVAAAAQQVMAQQMAHQYAMLQHQHMNQQQQQVQQQQVQQQQAQQQLIQQQQTSQSHEAPHVVLSQIPANMTTNSTPTTPTVNSMNPLHQIQPENMSLHNALLQQQQYINEQTTGIKRSNTDNTATLAKKKSRRHTVSSSHPPALNIDTKNLNPSMAPRSAAVPSYHKTETVKPTLGAISLPPRPTPQELGLTLESKAKDYANMTKEQLIARLIVLETEKLGTEKSEKMSDDEEEEDDEEDSPNTPTDHKLDEDKSTVDDDDEEEESVAEEEASASTAKPPAATTETPAVTQITCKWKDCGQVFDELQKLITHINDNHVGSGKPTYSCEWEGCPRNQKPFTKRHKMYNHLRTHTGERPFVCDKPGCGKRFSRPDSLTTHIKTHSNVRPFICLAKGCGKAYYHSRSLKKHEKIHENQTNYISSNSAPTTVGIPHPQMISVDYLSSQLQHQSPISIHGSESVPTSPHPALQQQQQQQNFAMLNHQQAKPYTPLVLSYPAGLEHNGEHIMAQQQQQLYDSVNQQQQQQQQQMSQQMSQQQQMPQQQQQPMLQQQQQQQGFEYRQA